MQTEEEEEEEQQQQQKRPDEACMRLADFLAEVYCYLSDMVKLWLSKLQG